MKPISNSLVESLKTLGLTEYEAKVYSALVLFDRTEVKQIYEYLDAPKPSVYQSLKTLTDKGLVQVVNAKPAIYRATPAEDRHQAHGRGSPEDGRDRARRAGRAGKQQGRARAGPDIVWTLYGTENVEHTMEELLGKAKRSVKLVLPDAYLGYLETLKGRDSGSRPDRFRVRSLHTSKVRTGHRRCGMAGLRHRGPSSAAKELSQLPGVAG